MRIRKHFLSLSASITAPPQQSPLDLSSGDHRHHEQPSLLVVQRQEEVHSKDDNKLSSFSDPSSKTKELESEKKKETIKIDVTGKKEINMLCAETSSHESVKPMKKRRVNHDDSEEEYNERKLNTKKKMKKNEKRGNVIMEGSRCSRVNGRGWRCGQQTIVGYSLCEHHLGKGRLRSMSTRVIRGHNVNAPKEQETIEMQDNELENDDVISSLGKKKKQVGHVVKERSLSSLLSQIDR